MLQNSLTSLAGVGTMWHHGDCGGFWNWPDLGLNPKIITMWSWIHPPSPIFFPVNGIIAHNWCSCQRYMSHSGRTPMCLALTAAAKHGSWGPGWLLPSRWCLQSGMPPLAQATCCSMFLYMSCSFTCSGAPCSFTCLAVPISADVLLRELN